MSRKIRTSILRSNNLTTLGKESKVEYNTNQQDKYNQVTNSFRYTLKSLSQQRNLIKILKKIDSPNQLSISGTSLKSEIVQTLFNLQQQLNSINNRRESKSGRNQKRQSYKVIKKCIPRSKINLADFCVSSNKKNVSKELEKQNSNQAINSSSSRLTNSNKQQKKQLNISRAILQKLKVMPLKNSLESCSSKQMTQNPIKRSINIVLNSKRKGIQIIQKIK